MAAIQRQILVYGGAGQVGLEVCKHFRQNGWRVFSCDFRVSAESDENVIVSGAMSEDAAAVLGQLGDLKGAIDAVVSVAGGWAGGAISSSSVFESVDRMIRFNLYSSVVASHVASQLLKPDGLLVLTGAESALGATPGMIGYGLSKVAVHHLVRSLADPASELPPAASVVAFLPRCIDTAQNRAGMPDADFSSWTPIPAIAERIFSWATSAPDARPARGSLISVVTEAGHTTWSPVSSI